jgi:ankyrin repeat protein
MVFDHRLALPTMPTPLTYLPRAIASGRLDKVMDIVNEHGPDCLVHKRFPALFAVCESEMDYVQGSRADQDDAQLQLAEFLLKAGANPNARVLPKEGDYRSGATPLMAAAWHYAKLDLLQLLLRHGANPRMRTPLGEGVLSRCEYSSPTLRGMSLLVDAGAPGDVAVDKEPALTLAVADNKVRRVGLFLKAGADPRKTIDSPSYGLVQGSLLHIACAADTVRLLLDHGVDPNARDLLAETPLHRQSDPESIRELVARGADVSARDRLGRTPLMAMARFTRVMAGVQALLASGADMEALDDDGVAAHEYLAQSEDPDVCLVAQAWRARRAAETALDKVVLSISS